MAEYRKPLWPIVMAWNVGVLIFFLAVPYDWKPAVIFVGFFGLTGHIIYLLRRRSLDRR
jgi:hypothetical protein